MEPGVDVLARPPVVRLSRAALGALVIALVVATLTGSGSSTASGRLGGDYPEYYASGRMVLDGHIRDVYDADAQTVAQAPYTGADGGLLFFGYPPHVAAAYAPLAALPYRLSYLLHTVLMALATIGALVLLRPLLGALRRAAWATTALGLTFGPLFVGVALGQNTGLSLLLLAATWRLTHDRRELSAGLVLGLLLFKPQLALPLLGLFLVSGRWRVGVGAAISALATWLAGAALMGSSWVAVWLGALSRFDAVDQATNASNSVSLMGMADAITHGSGTARLAAVLLDLGLALGLALLWHREGRRDLTGVMAITIPALLLLSPHALYYDAGLLVVTGAVVLSRAPRSLPAVLGVWAIGLTMGLAGPVGVSPVVLAVVAALVGTWFVGVVRRGTGPDPQLDGAGPGARVSASA